MADAKDVHPEISEKFRPTILGIDAMIPTGYGSRLLTYADWTATGRAVDFIEHQLAAFLNVAGNSHTEDSFSGRCATEEIHAAETMIKACVNAGPNGRVVCVGTGVTGAINKLQQILGVFLPPATRSKQIRDEKSFFSNRLLGKLYAHRKCRAPIVFVGPYEHHSNEITWRESLADVVEVRLDSENGGVDLAHLESLLVEHASRELKIGSFSACSNVTGFISDVRGIARVLHRHGALACFDMAASGPYVAIDMNPPDPLEKIDALVLSTHKFLGGVASSGVLVFDSSLYDASLPPTVPGGGTVLYVTKNGQDYTSDVEDRERSGTPGIVQTIKSALAMDLKRFVGVQRIEEREAFLVCRVMTRLGAHPRIRILGHPDPTRRIGIIAFNIVDPRGLSSTLSCSGTTVTTATTQTSLVKFASSLSTLSSLRWWGRKTQQPREMMMLEENEKPSSMTLEPIVHFRLVATLLNDLFGIQARAGCACAGPFGHELLHITPADAKTYRDLVVRDGYSGARPGWCRLSVHWTMDLLEVDFIANAVLWLADNAHHFLSQYRFDAIRGTWTRDDGVDHAKSNFTSAERAFSRTTTKPTEQRLTANERRAMYESYTLAAQDIVDSMIPETNTPSSPSLSSPECVACATKLGRKHLFFALA